MTGCRSTASPNLGAAKEISLEALIEAEPDFVIASCNTAADMELLPTFEAMGIPAAYFEVSTFEQYLAMLDRCTLLTGDRAAYKQNGTDVQAQVDEAIARARRQRAARFVYPRVGVRLPRKKTAGIMCWARCWPRWAVRTSPTGKARCLKI